MFIPPMIAIQAAKQREQLQKFAEAQNKMKQKHVYIFERLSMFW